MIKLSENDFARFKDHFCLVHHHIHYTNHDNKKVYEKYSKLCSLKSSSRLQLLYSVPQKKEMGGAWVSKILNDNF